MMILLVLTTTLSLLASWPVLEVNAQGPVDFDYPFFDINSRNSLNVLYNATIDTLHHVLKVTDPTDTWCDSHVCRGQIIYSTAIDFIDRNLERTYSFSTTFVFSLTIPGTVRSGEGFIFFIIANPYQSDGNGIGDYFGAFPSHGQTTTPTVAVEFDTVKNSEVYDVDDNHIGVDINKAISASQQSCYPVNLKLYEGQKIKVWIDYHDSIKMLEVRLAYWTSSVIRPANPLIEMNLDLTTLVDSKMYVGFSGESYSGQEQEGAIFSWSFHSKLETPAPPPPPRAPIGEIGSNVSTPDSQWENHGNNSRKNHTRSKEEDIIMGLCIGGGLGLILALGGSFWLGYYCSKKAAQVAKEEEDGRKKSEATGHGGDTEEDDQRKKYDEGNIASDDVEAGTFGAGILGPLLTRARSFKIAPTEDIDDPTFTALRKGSTQEFVTRKVKSAREIEAEGVESDAIEKGILAGHAPNRRRNQNFSTFDAPEFVDARRKKSWSPKSAITGRELVPLGEEETRADLPAPAFPDVGTAVSPDVATPAVEEGEVLTELPLTELTKEKEVVSHAAALPSAERAGDGRGDDADSGTSDIVYQITAKPSVSVDNPARRSNSWSPWSSEASNLGHSSPVGRTAPISSIEIKRTKSWGPWSSTRTREVQVVVKRSEAIRLRNPEVSTLERSSVSSPRRDLQRNPRVNPESTAPPAGTIMFTNTLYDSPQEEFHEPSPGQRPPQPGDDLYMDDNVNVRPTAENIYDRPSVAMDYGEEIVERIFDLEITKEDDDVDRVFDEPDSSDAPHRETSITSVTPSPVHTPAQSRGGSRLPSRAGTPSPSRKSSPAGTTTPSTAGTSGSSSTETTKHSEHRRVKRRPHWRY